MIAPISSFRRNEIFIEQSRHSKLSAVRNELSFLTAL
jgi:hypothetical protein